MSNLFRSRRKGFGLEIESLLHPANAFDHPSDVVEDADLTLNEKRAILASWASDACAVEGAPSLRLSLLDRPPVPVDDILDALRELDKADATKLRPVSIIRRGKSTQYRSGGGGRHLSA